MSAARWSVVVPTVARPQLRRMLSSLARTAGATPELVVLADDRPAGRGTPLDVTDLPFPVRVVHTAGHGPAAARNAGWRQVHTPWVVFLDDDVVLPQHWADALAEDLAALEVGDAASYGRLRVPVRRRPVDWERNTSGLERARWATADAAFRLSALVDVEGFDERFAHAYREDADLALRLRRAGWRLVQGSRTTIHPVRPAGAAVSVRTQVGARDDALLRALHGRRWRATAEVGRGRFRGHVATVAAGLLALGARATGQRRAASAAGVAWAVLTAEFVVRRIAPGPRPGDSGWLVEWLRMVWTSVAIPPVAVTHRTVGMVKARRDRRGWRPPVRAVLVDRDGTLVADVPYNGDPDRVVPMPGARDLLDVLRADGLAVGIVTNQSGIGRGLLSSEQVSAVNTRIDELLGPFRLIEVCPHAPEDGCSCRKPEPGLVLRAARRLGVAPWECLVIGDTGADVDAALAAGARAVLVPTSVTLPEEVAHAPVVAGDLMAALPLVRELAGRRTAVAP